MKKLLANQSQGISTLSGNALARAGAVNRDTRPWVPEPAA
jgi:hypothetical protein